jgi:hypothetical protein
MEENDNENAAEFEINSFDPLSAQLTIEKFHRFFVEVQEQSIKIAALQQIIANIDSNKYKQASNIASIDYSTFVKFT